MCLKSYRLENLTVASQAMAKIASSQCNEIHQATFQNAYCL